MKALRIPEDGDAEFAIQAVALAPRDFGWVDRLTASEVTANPRINGTTRLEGRSAAVNVCRRRGECRRAPLQSCAEAICTPRSSHSKTRAGWRTTSTTRCWR